MVVRVGLWSYLPLLRADQPATFSRRGKLGDVNGDLCGANTNAHSVDYTADDKHSDILRSGDDDRSNAPKLGRY